MLEQVEMTALRQRLIDLAGAKPQGGGEDGQTAVHPEDGDAVHHVLTRIEHSHILAALSEPSPGFPGNHRMLIRRFRRGVSPAR